MDRPALVCAQNWPTLSYRQDSQDDTMIDTLFMCMKNRSWMMLKNFRRCQTHLSHITFSRPWRPKKGWITQTHLWEKNRYRRRERGQHSHSTDRERRGWIFWRTKIHSKQPHNEERGPRTANYPAQSSDAWPLVINNQINSLLAH